jgi:chaperonin cofactor prefoldin
LEHLNFESSPYGSEGRHLLPPVLKKALDEVEEHWERIGQQVEAQDKQQRARDEEPKKHRI